MSTLFLALIVSVCVHFAFFIVYIGRAIAFFVAPTNKDREMMDTIRNFYHASMVVMMGVLLANALVGMLK